jgi:hypothetical protein
MELHLKIIGWLFILLACIHLIFPKYFNWEKDFRNVSLINRQMMYVHTFFIAFVVLLIGIFCLTSFSEISHTILGKRFCLGMAGFWFIRLIIQFVGYSPELWKGKKFETTMHITFSLLWTYVTGVFFSVYWF